ncbi:phosphate transport system permease protein PstA [Algimonas arctica]|uniref:Phosphate transport system permease protein PstA n=1 Tax=Algimonas arctica TaxID=1479486 RepID=A0A8J3G3E1_9PROT|nr:PstA family ABC transporter permease [Algimonas arctica]GHB03622.1 phosphate transport system permease protein PstA [Algimonas arctica]
MSATETYSDTPIKAAITTAAMEARMRKRRAAERRFRVYGQAAVAFSIAALAWLLISIVSTGASAFTQHWVTLDLTVTAQTNASPNDRRRLADALADVFGEVSDEASRRELLQVISASVATADLRAAQNLSEPLQLIVPASDLTDQYLKGHIDPNLPEDQRKITNRQIEWIAALDAEGRVHRRFNRGLFANPDSRDPERAGLASAIFGSIMIVLIASALALPVGIGAAIYLDSFAPQTGWGGRLTRMLEVNINNLAAVPSIVFGLLGLAVFINFFGLPRSIPLVGGLVLALRMFPTIVIASRASLLAVPVSLTDSALSLGASRMQAVFNHRVPLAAPGMMTGSIIGMAQALGETAPLLMIGMVAFVTTVPSSPMDPATALPVQIFLWSGSAEAAWAERASAAIISLLVVLMFINGIAIILRERLQRRRKL